MAQHFVRSGPGSYLALILLAGCSGLPRAPVVPAPASAVSQAARGAVGASWMRADAKSKDLLYVTNGVIDVYSYPQGELVGQITSQPYPLGSCSDAKGDVYFTNYTTNDLVEFAHAGTQALRTLKVPGSGPVSCAADPSSGDLAVTVAGNSSGVGAGLVVFHKAKGKPKTYTDKAIASYSYCTYDGSGNLFADGTPAEGYGYNYELAELARGSRTLEPVGLQGGVSWAAPLQWDGKYLAVGQPVPPNIWQFTVSDGYGTQIGNGTPLTGAYDARQFIIAGKQAIVTNLYYYDVYVTRWDVLVFNYPAGGEETQEIMWSSEPVYSVALSRHGT